MADQRNPFDNPNPFRLTEEQRRRLSDSLLLQKPPNARARETFEELARKIKTIEGIPVDVLFTLEAIRLQAEQGNETAKWLYWRERERLGIDIPRRITLPG